MSTYIFLDIDGVLNRSADWTRNYTLSAECIHNLNDFLASVPSPKIILISSWRIGLDTKSFAGNPPHLQILLTKLGLVDGDRVRIEKTGISLGRNRGDEILHYLKWHPPAPYVILDDEPEQYRNHPLRDKVCLIASSSGFTKKDAARARKKTNPPYKN